MAQAMPCMSFSRGVEIEIASTSGRCAQPSGLNPVELTKKRRSSRRCGLNEHGLQMDASSAFSSELWGMMPLGLVNSVKAGTHSAGAYQQQSHQLDTLKLKHAEVAGSAFRCMAVAIAGDFGRRTAKTSQAATALQEKPPKELLAQVRRRKELEKLQRDQEQTDFCGTSGTESAAQVVWPFWRKKRSQEEREARQLTSKIVELGRRKNLEQVFQVLALAKREKKRVNLITMNAVLAACVNCEDTDRAMQVFKEMVQPDGVGADSITYGTLLKGLGQAKRLDDAFELLESIEMGTAPGKPQLTDVHLNTLINACAEAGEALRARGLLQRYRNFAYGQGPSTFTYNLLIKGYARSDNPLEALNLVAEMQLQGLPLQRLTYNSLILACVRGGDLEKAMEFLDEMKAEARRLGTSRLLPDVVTYTTLLKGLAEDGDLEGVLQLASEMKNTVTCVIDRVAYTAVIDACIEAGSAQDGMRVMEEMEERAKEEPQLRPRAHVFLALMRAFAARGDIVRTQTLAERFVRDAAGQVWPEDKVEASELLMESAVNAGEFRLGRQLLHSLMVAQRGKPQLSSRATQVVVQLMAHSDSSFDPFRPLMFKPEVSPRSSIQVLMHNPDSMHPAHPEERVADLTDWLEANEVLPVIDASLACVGAVFMQDFPQMESLVCEVMREAPPRIPHDATVSEAASLFMQHKAELLTVVEGFGPRHGLLRGRVEADMGTVAIGFLTRTDIFDFEGRRKCLGEECYVGEDNEVIEDYARS